MNDTPEPTELIYPPRSSWAPALLAGGLAGAIAGFTFLWWPYGVIGAAVALCALVSFLRHSWRDLVRLPRKQPVATAPLPLARRARKAPETSDAT